jgi:hypothetical protein
LRLARNFPQRLYNFRRGSYRSEKGICGKVFAASFDICLTRGLRPLPFPIFYPGKGMPVPAFQCVLGLVVSAVSGIAAIKFLVSMLGRNNLNILLFTAGLSG